ncbi:uncharacterized protein LOC133832234 [Humulus lupulus]|uniref:uncharacterized protein LOC133832234 n=1 Tax=Humulus lupulus TaxID=3486 RepID=UPI002B4028C9|nr:uncharacterized protein LOC133832234 [Humulus lupulus]
MELSKQKVELLEDKATLTKELLEARDALKKANESREKFRESAKLNYQKAVQLELDLVASRQEVEELRKRVQELEEAGAKDLEKHGLRAILTLTAGRLRSGAVTEQSRTLVQRHIEELKAADVKYAEQLEAVLEEKNKLAAELREKYTALDKAIDQKDNFKESNRINYREAKKFEHELVVSRQETTTLEGRIKKLEQANASNLERS